MCSAIKRQSAVLLAACITAVLFTAAWIGMDFSPSFTTMFLTAFLAVAILEEGCVWYTRQKEKVLIHIVRRFVYGISVLLLFASVFIYAAGDDWLKQCVVFALLGYVAICILSHYMHRKKDHETNIKCEKAEEHLLFAAALFALACARSSTALWPYGLGLMAFWYARRERRRRGFTIIHGMLFLLGTALDTLFLLAPMLF